MKTSYDIHGNDRGFTLVELIITLAVFIIIIAGVLRLYESMHETWVAEDVKATMQQEGRVAMDNMVREMMMMGYGSEEKRKILEATQNSIRFEESLQQRDASGVLTANLEGARVRYFLDGDALKRNVDYLGTTADTGDVTLIENVDSLRFEYYDADNAFMDYSSFLPTFVSDAAPGAEDGRKLIRRVTVALTVRSSRKMPGTDDYKYMTLKADLSPRNLWEGEASLDKDPPPAVGWLKVRDTGNCDKLQAQWQRSTAPDLGGYVLKYGTTDGIWTGFLDVPAVEDDTSDPTAEFSVSFNPYTADSGDAEHTSYYVTVVAYDRSYNSSAELTPSVGVADPDPSITTFDGDDNDTANNVDKPAAPAGLALYNSDTEGGHYDAACPENAIMLRWTVPSDTNVVGYRIYRSTSEFVSFPINEAHLIAKETEAGDGWVGARTDRAASNSSVKHEYADGMFIDKDPAIIGCKTYYYAICAVTCDVTRIYGDATHITEKGGRYTEEQFARTHGASHESIPPEAPGFTARAGWKRVFLQLDWPSDQDYDRTEIYFKQGELVLPFNTTDYHLIVDRQYGVFSGDPAGNFFNYGTAAQGTVIFNTEGDTDISDTALPQLDNAQDYAFVAVSYDKCGNTLSETEVATTFADLCGDDPCGKPLWDSAPTVWINAAGTNRDASTWSPADPDGNTQIDIKLEWTDVNKTNPSTALDFYGYNVSSALLPAGPYSNAIAVGEWNSFVENAGLVEGQSYSYKVQATDCVWQNITELDTIECVATGVLYGYDAIKANNITPIDEAPGLENIQPGKFRKYKDEGVPSAKENFAYTTGQFHNEVHFYLQNTSASEMVIQSMAFNWGNTSVKLKSMKFMATAYDPEQTYPAGVGVQTHFNIARTINDVASGVDNYSAPIETVLTFVNLDGSVNEACDMRYDTIEWEAKFKNLSMPSNAAHTTFVGDFTTGAITDPSRVQSFGVAGGPVINTVFQNQPANPTISAVVTEDAMPAVVLEVDGLTPVAVTANITKPSTETLNSVWLRWYETGPSDTDTSAGVLNELQMWQSGSDFRGTLPALSDKGIWYYIYAISNQGTEVRKPLRENRYYYYRQLPYDVCLLTPMAPEIWGWYDSTMNRAELSWSYEWTMDPTTGIWGEYYEEGALHDAVLDPFTYNVYRKVEGEPAFTKILSTTDTFVAYTGLSAPTEYYVTVQNTCADPGPVEGAESQHFTACAGAGSGCRGAIQGSSSVTLYIWDPAWYAWSGLGLRYSVCSLANDGIPWDVLDLNYTTEMASGTIYLYEDGDSGSFTSWPSVTNDPYYITSPDGWTITATGPGNRDDQIVFSLPTYGCDDMTVQVSQYNDPCGNIPSATTIVHASRVPASGSIKSKTSLTFNKVTTNTDGTAIDTSGDTHLYRLYYQNITKGTAADSLIMLGYTDNGDGTLTWLQQPLISSSDKSDTFKFWIVLEDGCSTPNVSASSNVVSLGPSTAF